VKNIPSDRVRLTVRLSSGIDIAWISGIKNEKEMSSNLLELDFRSFLSGLSVYVAVRPVRRFEATEAFSMQIVAQFSEAESVVCNRSWRKATSLGEWLESINIIVFTSFALKQKSARQLLGRAKKPLFGKRFEWDLSALSLRDHQVQVIKKAVGLFQNLFLDENSKVPANVRRAILYMIMSRGPQYTGSLASSLMVITGKEDYLAFPPFTFCEKTFANPPGDVIVFLDDFNAIQLQIRRYMC
jgi:hypothetical protein